MRVPIWISGSLLLLVGQAVLGGCGSSEDGGPVSKTCVEGELCECIDRASCDLQCDDLVGCAPTCRNFDTSCTAACTEDCDLRCQGGDRVDGFCEGLCGDDCDARCSAVASCSLETGANSSVICTNATNCAAELGEGSILNCLGIAETCAARCFGTCEVFCSDAGACNVNCINGDQVECGEGFFVCGECPMTEG